MIRQQRPTKEKAPTHIRDARGRKVTQIDPVELHLLRRHAVIDAESLRPIAEEVGSGLDEKARRFVPVLVGGLVLVALALVVMVIAYAIEGNVWDIISPRSIALFNVWFFAMVFWTQAKQGRFGRIKRIMLRHHRCPHCGYDLRGLPADPEDGTTACPECGCAWQVPEEAG
jgi:hypothetical protein